MTARLLDGKAIAAEVVEGLRARVAAMPTRPGLGVILVGDDPASAVYVRNKTRTAESLGFHHRQITLPATASEAEVLARVAELGADAAIHGILVQFPVPARSGARR